MSRTTDQLLHDLNDVQDRCMRAICNMERRMLANRVHGLIQMLGDAGVKVHYVPGGMTILSSVWKVTQ